MTMREGVGADQYLPLRDFSGRTADEWPSTESVPSTRQQFCITARVECSAAILLSILNSLKYVNTVIHTAVHCHWLIT
jgi:hypothetical protein